MKNIGLLLLGVWLIAAGLKSVIQLSFVHDNLILGLLAIVAGVFVVLRR